MYCRGKSSGNGPDSIIRINACIRYIVPNEVEEVQMVDYRHYQTADMKKVTMKAKLSIFRVSMLSKGVEGYTRNDHVNHAVKKQNLKFQT